MCGCGGGYGSLGDGIVLSIICRQSWRRIYGGVELDLIGIQNIKTKTRSELSSRPPHAATVGWRDLAVRKDMLATRLVISQSVHVT